MSKYGLYLLSNNKLTEAQGRRLMRTLITNPSIDLDSLSKSSTETCIATPLLIYLADAIWSVDRSPKQRPNVIKMYLRAISILINELEITRTKNKGEDFKEAEEKLSSVYESFGEVLKEHEVLKKTSSYFFGRS